MLGLVGLQNLLESFIGKDLPGQGLPTGCFHVLFVVGVGKTEYSYHLAQVLHGVGPEQFIQVFMSLRTDTPGTFKLIFNRVVLHHRLDIIGKILGVLNAQSRLVSSGMGLDQAKVLVIEFDLGIGGTQP